MNTDTPVSLLFLLVVRCGTRPTTQSVVRLAWKGGGGQTKAVRDLDVGDLCKQVMKWLVQVCLIDCCVMWDAVVRKSYNDIDFPTTSSLRGCMIIIIA